MNGKKSCCLLLIAVLLVGAFYGCGRSKNETALEDCYNLISQEEMKQYGHKKVSRDYQTNKSIAFENEDGTKTLYVFASPIRYREGDKDEWHFIDTALQEIHNGEDENFYTVKASDIQPYFPAVLDSEHGVALRNNLTMSFQFDGDYTSQAVKKECADFIAQQREALLYNNVVFNEESLYVYPTSVGANFELKLSDKPPKNTFDAWINLSKEYAYLEKVPAGYLAVIDKRVEGEMGNVLGVLQAPMIRNGAGEVSVNNQVEIVEQVEGKGYRVRFTLDAPMLEAGSTVFWAMELRREKQSDNAIYSNHPLWQQSYLTNYGVIGLHEDFGIGRMMTRFDFTKTFRLKSENILDAHYDTYVAYQTDPAQPYNAYYINGEWCAVFGNWKSNYQTGELAASAAADGNLLSWNITDAVKRWCVDQDKKGELEQFGLMLQSSTEEKSAYAILLSHDNTLYPTRTVVQLSK